LTVETAVVVETLAVEDVVDVEVKHNWALMEA